MISTSDLKELSPKEYESIRQLVYETSGINLGGQKMQLVKARLGKLMRRSGLTSFRDYYDLVKKDNTGERLVELIDAISTNTTHLFREIRHFKILHRLIQDWASHSGWRNKNDKLRIWSAASSSGEEPHSIAIVAHDALQHTPNLEVKILATDISTQMLTKARRGCFSLDSAEKVPPAYKHRYLQKTVVDGQPMLQAVPEIRRMISFVHFNLMTPQYPFKHGFNIVFCRNVMIYFDRPTQQTLIGKIARHLRDDGYLMIGHSENLNSIHHPLTYVEPTVYRK